MTTRTPDSVLSRVDAELQILFTLNTYVQSLDYGNIEEFLDCWTEDAVLVWPGFPSFEGREAGIRDAITMSAGHLAPNNKHLNTVPVIHVEGDRATVSSYFATLINEPDGVGVRSHGTYKDVLVRCDDGRWRFQERIAEREGGRSGA